MLHTRGEARERACEFVTAGGGTAGLRDGRRGKSSRQGSRGVVRDPCKSIGVEETDRHCTPTCTHPLSCTGAFYCRLVGRRSGDVAEGTEGIEQEGCSD